jgi:Xaa-Pro aminopeptidase
VYPHQAERLSEALERARLDALVATSPENIAYLTGFRRSTEAGVPAPVFGIFTRQGAALVLPAMDVPMVSTDAIDHVVCFGEFHAAFPDPPTAEAQRLEAIVRAAAGYPAEAVAAALERLGIFQGSVGLDESRLTHQAWTDLADRLAGIKIVAGAGHLGAARRVKGPYEIECLSHALRVAEEALDVVIQMIERGTTEREAATLFTTEIVKRGGRPYPPMIAMGERSGIPAPWPTDRALRAGDLVRFDVGCAYNGYCSSVGRTAVLGEPATRQEAAYRAIQGGLETAVAAVTAGGAAARVFDMAMSAVRANGLSQYERGDIGHGIGLEPHEPPDLASGSGTPLEMGEVLCLETSYYEIGTMGVSVKDTVLVTSAGARVLNRSRHDLVVLD